jgi:hypothetical protein
MKSTEEFLLKDWIVSELRNPEFIVMFFNIYGPYLFHEFKSLLWKRFKSQLNANKFIFQLQNRLIHFKSQKCILSKILRKMLNNDGNY